MLEKLTNIIREHTGDNSIEINEDMDLKADLGLNSLDLVNLACVVEDEFDIEIPNEEAEKIVTVADAVEAIKNALNNN